MQGLATDDPCVEARSLEGLPSSITLLSCLRETTSVDARMHLADPTRKQGRHRQPVMIDKRLFDLLTVCPRTSARQGETSCRPLLARTPT